MTAKERVLRAIEFRGPDRIPFCTSIDHDNAFNIAIDGAVKARYSSDILIATQRNPHYQPPENGADEWGCVWSGHGFTMGEVTGNPLLDWGEFARFARDAPDLNDPSRYAHVAEARLRHPDQFLLSGLGFMMMDIINFRGYQNYMMDFYLERENLSLLIELIYQKAYQQIDRYAQCGSDGIIAWEDWGLQDRLMLSPDLWREIFKPPMAEMVRYIHGKGMKYILHSCGDIRDILDDLLEMGVDVLQLDQQRNMGLEVLAPYVGKLAFFCPADIQFSSGNRDGAAINAYCHSLANSLANSLATAHGGFLYKTYSQPKSVEIPLEAVLAECQAFRECNPYRSPKEVRHVL